MKIDVKFWQGQIADALACYEQLSVSKSPKARSEIIRCAAEIIGALVFSGDLSRAIAVADSLLPELDGAGKSGVLFYLLVGEVRVSQYGRAKAYVSQIQRLVSKRRPIPLSEFYLRQGEAFYLYYQSEFLQAKDRASEAVLAAFAARFKFGELLARDMLGGALVQTGEISHGLSELMGARKIAEILGHGNFADAVTISLVCYKAHFGRLQKPLRDLKRTLATVSPEDTYSISELKLELARQHMLRGQIKKAESILRDCSEFIYASQNQRQTSTLHLRWAFLLYCRGQYHQALTLVQVAEKSLRPGNDDVFLARLHGLQAMIVKSLGLAIPQAQEFRSDYVDARIVARRTGTVIGAKSGEDRIGDLADSLCSGSFKNQLDVVRATGAWYFLADILNLTREASYLIYGVVGRRMMTIFSEGEIAHCEKEILGTQMRVLQQIASGPKSKEDLVLSVWGYRYAPERHDSMVYSAISAIRRSLGEYGYWVRMDDDRYSLKPGVELRAIDSSEPAKKANDVGVEAGTIPTNLTVGRFLPELNFRQNSWLFSDEPRIDPFSIRDYETHFGISTMTAFRDVQGLLSFGHLVRTGYGRATRYYGAGGAGLKVSTPIRSPSKI